MDREQRQRSYRKTLGVAIGVSVGLHVAALAWVKLNVPTFGEPQESRALQVLQLPNAWENSALEVVPLESAIVSAPNGALEGASATSAQVDLPEPGAGGGGCGRSGDHPHVGTGRGRTERTGHVSLVGRGDPDRAGHTRQGEPGRDSTGIRRRCCWRVGLRLHRDE